MMKMCRGGYHVVSRLGLSAACRSTRKRILVAGSIPDLRLVYTMPTFRLRDTLGSVYDCW